MCRSLLRAPAASDVVVYEPGRLHEGVGRCRADEPPLASLEGPRKVARFCRLGRQIGKGRWPEGTRRRVEQWKSGFWKIARRAEVPVFCAWFHYPTRTIGLGPLVHLSDDQAADMARIREIYRPHIGKNRDTL